MQKPENWAWMTHQEQKAWESGHSSAEAQADYVPPVADACCDDEDCDCGFVPRVPCDCEDSILDEADRVAGENRSRDYGHPLINHERIAAIWNAQLGPKLTGTITAKDVALMMVGLKLARLVASPNHRDSLVDIVGYVKCWDMMDQVQ
jgi:hypothetical protein